jgi:hypothetical protein
MITKKVLVVFKTKQTKNLWFALKSSPSILATAVPLLGNKIKRE